MLHDVVPMALPPLLRVVLLLVLVTLLVTLSPLVPVLVLLALWWMLTLPEVDAAAGPVTARHSTRARRAGTLMMGSE